MIFGFLMNTPTSMVRPAGRPVLFFLFLLLLLLPPFWQGCRPAIEPTVRISDPAARAVAEPTKLPPPPATPLPRDPLVEKGTLENGLTYYIRVNREPENRAELRLVVKAGSVLEDEDQRGLAHFVEHMAFNGTTRFPGTAVVDTLESFGMALGHGINASTGFDATVYQLHIPTREPEMLDRAFLILEDWAHGIAFLDKDIEEERGVVLEEWRLGLGASTRQVDKILPVLLRGSRYAERLPIGTREGLENFGPEPLRRFYRQWYRPDLMAVVAVGDFDPAAVRERISRHFGAIAGPEEVRPRPGYPVPAHERPLFVAAVDPEAAQTVATIHFKRRFEPQETVADYRQQVVEQLFNGMFNARLDEIGQQADAPFLFAAASGGRLTPEVEDYTLSVAAAGNSIRRGMEALLLEAERVRRHGFTSTELERQKREMLTNFSLLFRERHKTPSAVLAAEYGRNFLEDEPIPGIAYEYELVRSLLPDIDPAEVNRMAGELLGEENRVVVIQAPEKESALPTEAEAIAMLERMASVEVEPYPDETVDLPLVAALPAPGAIVAEQRFESLEVTEWRLANGMRVLLKPTDFRNDEVLFAAYSPGGHSLVEDGDYMAALTAATLVEQSGLGEFTRSGLRKKLAGRAVAVTPRISELTESLGGLASSRDLETMFRLVYLYMTAPRADAPAFEALKSRLRAGLANRLARPETGFYDTVNEIMSRGHFRRLPLTESRLDEMDLERSLAIFRDRFDDAGNFTCILVGSFTLEEIRPLVQRYLATLPAGDSRETWRDVGVERPSGRIHREVRQGLEPKSMATLIYSGPFVWNPENRFIIQSMADLLRRRLRDRLREEMGSTYSVEVDAATSHYPDPEYHLSNTFGGSPERMEAIIAAARAEIESLRRGEPAAEEMHKIKEGIRRAREIELRSNAFWLDVLQFYAFHQEDPRQLLEFDTLLDNLGPRDMREAAAGYFNLDNYVQVVLYPENENQD